MLNISLSSRTGTCNKKYTASGMKYSMGMLIENNKFELQKKKKKKKERKEMSRYRSLNLIFINKRFIKPFPVLPENVKRILRCNIIPHINDRDTCKG